MTSVPPGYKQTEVGVIPEDWEVKPLVALANIRSGIAKNSNKVVSSPVSVHYLRVANVQDGFLDLSEMSEIRVNRDDVTRYALRPGDVLMNEGGDLDKLGRGAMWRGEFTPCIHQNHVFVVRCGSSLFPDYLNVWTGASAARHYFLIAGKQTTNLASINKTALGQLPIPLPPTKAEQEAIAETLSNTDALIESLEQLIIKKRQLKQGAMQELLTGKKRLPGFSGEWRSCQMGEVIVHCSSGATPYRGRPDFYKGDVKWITSGELNYNVITDTIEHISREAVEKTNLKIHPAGTLLIAITGLEATGTRGSCGIVGSPATTNQSCMAIYPAEELTTEFLYHYYVLRGDELALRYCQGTKQQSYTAKLVKLLPIDLPPTVEEQTAIATILSDMDAEIAALNENLTKTKKIKQGMMQELLTGRIRLVSPTAKVIPFPTKKKPATVTNTHNWEINEAVIIGVLAKNFGSEKYPLARKRCTKLTYLLHRHAEGKAEGYLKKAAGPYNPRTRYSGPERIAQKNRYVRACHNGTYEGFVATDNVVKAEAYFQQWYGSDALAWLERFRYHKTDELELLATVDMAMEELKGHTRPTTLETVKRVIHDHPEWNAKLDRETFCDDNIDRAIQTCRELFL